MEVSRSVVLAGGGVLLLAAGFALGTAFSGGSPPEVRTVVATDTVPTPAPAAPPPAPAPSPAAPGPAAAPAPTSDLSPSDREALRAILDRQPVREVPTGSGVISGVVRTEEGVPLAAVAISLTPEIPRAAGRSGPPAADPDPVDGAAMTYQWALFRKRALRTAVTDAAGAFRFEGLADVKHRLDAKRKGWQFRAKDYRQMYEARIGAAVEILASPSVEVRVEVSWPGTEAPANLQVQFRTGNSTSNYGLNPDNPVLTVKPGAYEVSVQGGTNLRSEVQSVEIPAEGEPPVLRFALKGRPGIQGRLLFPEGEEIDQVQVVSRKLLPEQKAEAGLFAGSLDHGGGGTQREPGRYAIPDLAPGRYAVGVTRGWNLPVVHVEEVEVTDGPVERDLRVPPLQPGDYVALSVFGPDGSLLRDYQLTTGYRSRNSSSSGGSVAAARPDGTRWVLHHASGMKEDADGTWWIEVASPKYGTRRAEYRRGAQDAVVIRFEEPGRVDVRLEGYRGHSHEGRLRVALQQRSADGSSTGLRGFRGDDRVGEDGTQTFLQVQPGEYVVILQASGERMPYPVAKVAVTVKGGRNDVPLKVPPLHSVTITGAESTIFCRSREDSSFNIFARPDAEGKAILDGLPEGEYEVRSGSKSQTLRVPGTSEVHL